MKSNARPSFYFSAYPLKAISNPAASAANQTNQQTSPYLKSVLSGKSKPLSRSKVFAMKNPYAKPVSKIRLATPPKKTKDVDPSGKEWFNNYE